MAEHTGVTYAHHTFSPWWSCTKVSAGCANCFAEKVGARRGIKWGRGEPRVRTAASTWKQPRRWDKAAALAGERRRVLVSMCDPFDLEAPAEWRADFYELIRATPNLTWLLLTKRPENLRFMLPADWHDGAWRNLWPGVTVEDQPAADQRLDLLMDASPRRGPGAILFASCEPLLAPLDLSRWLDGSGGCLDWVIAGCEKLSGQRPGRPCQDDWARRIRDDCLAAGVPLWLKQLERAGKVVVDPELDGRTWLQVPPGLPRSEPPADPVGVWSDGGKTWTPSK